jgi:hypothetical protein
MSGVEILFGVVVPGAVFVISLWLTFWLYRKFS